MGTSNHKTHFPTAFQHSPLASSSSSTPLSSSAPPLPPAANDARLDADTFSNAPCPCCPSCPHANHPSITCDATINAGNHASPSFALEVAPKRRAAYRSAAVTAPCRRVARWATSAYARGASGVAAAALPPPSGAAVACTEKMQTTASCSSRVSVSEPVCRTSLAAWEAR